MAYPKAFDYDLPPNTNEGRHNNKIRVLLVGVVLFLSLGYLFYNAFPGNALYYLTLSEVLQDEVRIEGKSVRIVGKLTPDSFHRIDGTIHARFTITDGDNILNASYTGVLPDLFFNPESEIVLEGQYQPGEVFHTTNVIVKCPSKYSAPSEEIA